MAVLLLGLACGGVPDASSGANNSVDDPAGQGVVARDLPGHAPSRFGFGSPASPARVARVDIDVKPDGQGLPPGSGSVARGRKLYQVYCAQCHGATGVEGPNDPLVGAGPWGEWPQGRAFGGYWPYATTLFDYTRRAMPQTTPGILTDSEVYAVTGHILHLNGLVSRDAVMDSTTLVSIEMPYRDRFVPDDRRGGPEVR